MPELQVYPRSINGIMQVYHNFIQILQDITRRQNGLNILMIGSLILLAFITFILTWIWTFQIYGIDNSALFNKYENMLKQQYIVGVYTNSSCNPGDQEVYYKVPATIDGCKCQEQLYTSACTQQQKDQQKCKQINSTDSIILNQWPFQLDNNLSYAQKICIIKSKTSLYEQITQNNNCSLQCGDENNHLCIMNDEQCPISHFQINQQMLIIKERRQQTIIRIDNVQRNIQEPLIGMIVTNGNCSSLQNRSNYILKKEDQNCEFQQQMVPIMEYKALQILKVNQKFQEYRDTRQFDDLNKQSYIINGLRQYYVTPQCRFKNNIINSIYELQMNEITILCTLVVFIIFQIINLLILFSLIRQENQQNSITKCFKLFYYFYLILIFILFVLSTVYQVQIRNSCWNLQLETVNLALPLISIIFTLSQLALFFNAIKKVFYQNQAIEQAQVHPETVDQDYSNSIQEQSSQNYQPQNNDETQNRTSLSMALNSIQARRFQSIEEQDSAVTKTDGDINSPIQSNKNQRQQLKKPRQNSKKIYRQVAPLDIIQFEQEENQFNRVRPLPD